MVIEAVCVFLLFGMEATPVPSPCRVVDTPARGYENRYRIELDARPMFYRDGWTRVTFASIPGPIPHMTCHLEGMASVAIFPTDPVQMDTFLRAYASETIWQRVDARPGRILIEQPHRE